MAGATRQNDSAFEVTPWTRTRVGSRGSPQAYVAQGIPAASIVARRASPRSGEAFRRAAATAGGRSSGVARIRVAARGPRCVRVGSSVVGHGAKPIGSAPMRRGRPDPAHGWRSMTTTLCAGMDGRGR